MSVTVWQQPWLLGHGGAGKLAWGVSDMLFVILISN